MVAEFSKQTGGGGPPSMADYNSAISAWCECEGRVKDLQAINAELLAALEAIAQKWPDEMTEQWHERQATGSCDRHILSKTGPVCIIPYDWGSPSQRTARAKLIIAAPELLAALEAIELWSRDHPNGTCEAINEKARAAIAKAKP